MGYSRVDAAPAHVGNFFTDVLDGVRHLVGGGGSGAMPPLPGTNPLPGSRPTATGGPPDYVHTREYWTTHNADGSVKVSDPRKDPTAPPSDYASTHNADGSPTVSTTGVSPLVVGVGVAALLIVFRGRR